MPPHVPPACRPALRSSVAVAGAGCQALRLGAVLWWVEYSVAPTKVSMPAAPCAAYPTVRPSPIAHQPARQPAGLRHRVMVVDGTALLDADAENRHLLAAQAGTNPGVGQDVIAHADAGPGQGVGGQGVLGRAGLVVGPLDVRPTRRPPRVWQGVRQAGQRESGNAPGQTPHARLAGHC